MSKFISGFHKLTTIANLLRPELRSQGNITAPEGCSIWRQHIAPLEKLGYECVAPAVTTSLKGSQWLHDFTSLCPEVKVRFMLIVFVWR